MKFCNIFWTLLNKVNHETELIENYISNYMVNVDLKRLLNKNNHIASFTTG